MEKGDGVGGRGGGRGWGRGRGEGVVGERGEGERTFLGPPKGPPLLPTAFSTRIQP